MKPEPGPEHAAWPFALAAALFLSGCAGSPGPAFEIELWPGEGRPVFVAAGEPLSLREEPRHSAEVVARLEPPEGTELPFTSTRYRTVVPGRLEALVPVSVEGRSLGAVTFVSLESYYAADAPTRSWALEAGDTLELLQHRAEGTCFVRREGEVLEAEPCPALDTAAFRIATEARTEWWILVVPEGALEGGPERSPETPSRGWVEVGDQAVREAARRF